jgi:ABC-type branched-subunit amino acid transport system ATPase component
VSETTPKIALRSQNLKKHFGAIKAVDGVTFSLEEGTLHSIMGLMEPLKQPFSIA